MKCRNCGLAKDAHIEAPGALGRVIWRCPNGSGDTYPTVAEAKLELHYRAGEQEPWLATWVHPMTGPGEAAAGHPVEALELAARKIEEGLEEQPPEEKAIKKAIQEK